MIFWFSFDGELSSGHSLEFNESDPDSLSDGIMNGIAVTQLREVSSVLQGDSEEPCTILCPVYSDPISPAA